MSRRKILPRQAAPLILAAVLCMAAACNSATEPLRPEQPAAETVHSIAQLKNLCAGLTSTAVTRDIVIQGRIVGNDLYGEFYKTLVVEDASGGISIAVDQTPLADTYRWGALLTVRCNGLWLCDYGGKIMLGAQPGEFGAGRIPEEELARYFTVSQNVATSPLATPLALSEVGPRHIDTRVRFDNVRFEQQGVMWCDFDPLTGQCLTTERTILDPDGNRFVVRTASTCSYATEPLPSGSGSLYGVVDYFAGKYSLHVSNRGALFDGPFSAAAPPTACPSDAGCSAQKPMK